MSKENQKVTLRTLRSNYNGQKIIFPIDGETKIHQDGTFKVSEDLAELLLEQFPQKYEAMKIKKSKSKPEEDEDEEEDDSNDSNEDEDEEEDEEVDLNTLNKEELVELAEEAEYPAEEWEKFKNNKKLMVSFLKKKLEDNE